MNLNDVHHGIHKNKSRKRIGRGPRLRPGQDRRPRQQGARLPLRLQHARPIFEGGQMPLVRRIPKRGFTNRFAETVADRQSRVAGEALPERRGGHARGALRQGLAARQATTSLKVLGDGELTKNLKISAHHFSRSAAEKIEKAGGQAVVLPGKKPVVKNKMKVKSQ